MSDVEDPAKARAERRVGTVLKEKWRLDRLVGVGGMAAVYAATHRNGKRVAVKMLHVEHSANTDVRERFLREGYVANAVEHDGAVRRVDAKPLPAVAAPNPTMRVPAATLTTSSPVVHRPIPTVSAPLVPIALAALGAVISVVVSVTVLARYRSHSTSSEIVDVVAVNPPIAPPTPSALPAPIIASASAEDINDLLPVASHQVTRTGGSSAPMSRPITTSAATVKPSCSPPFEFDAKGVKRWKVGCL